METGDVVTVPVVATLVLEPPSMFHEETLVPVPETLLYIPFELTVVELPPSYHWSLVGEAVPKPIPLPLVTVR